MWPRKAQCRSWRDLGVAGPVLDWIGLLREFSATDIERVNVAMAQLPLPPRIKSLRLSYTDISTWFSNPLHLASLTELAFYPGGCQPEKICWGRWDAYLPKTLQSLQFDTGHHPYVSAQNWIDEDPEPNTLYAPCTRSLLHMAQLADLQAPLGLCFWGPDAMAGSSVTGLLMGLLPPSLKKVTLKEVWGVAPLFVCRTLGLWGQSSLVSGPCSSGHAGTRRAAFSRAVALLAARLRGARTRLAWR